MKIESFRDNRGITLVALVITIIVLLILAGVSLNLAVGGDGIVNKAIDASTAYTEAQIKETIDSAYQQAVIGQYLDKDITSSEIASSIQTTLENQYDNVSVTAIENDGGYTVEIGDDKYTVTDSGTTKNETTNSVINLSNMEIEITDETGMGSFILEIRGLDASLTPVSVRVNNDSDATKYNNNPLRWDLTMTSALYWNKESTFLITVEDGEGHSAQKSLPANSPTCFVAGTKVLTQNGLKNIEDIKIGDKVVSMNMENMTQEEKVVTNKFIHETTEEIYNIYVGDEVIRVTYAHLIYTKNKDWLPVYKLNVGDILNDAENNDVVITDIIIEKNEDIKKVYNLEVKDNHTYFVGESNILVHNAKEPLAPQI